jgi:DNA-binding beta-propeller fold protein YncE
MLSALAVLLLAPAAHARVGSLSQLHGKAGCVAQQTDPKSVKRGCTVARFGGHQMWAAVVSPDGRNLYVASIGGAISVLQIRHGRLHQPRGRAGCLSRTGAYGCRVVPELTLTETIAVSRDAHTVYVGSADRSGVAGGVVIFARNRKTGALRRIGCVGEKGAGVCTPARALFRQVSQVAVSRNGGSVYVGSNSADPGAAKSGALAVFRRAHGGSLTQLAGTAGCVNGDGAEGCAQARGLLPDCCQLVVSPSSRNVYAASSRRILQPGSFEGQSASFAIASFAAGPSGALTQFAGPSGCIDRDGSDGCAAAAFAGAEPVNEAAGIVVSPDGRDVYVTHTSAAPDSETNSCGGSDSSIAGFRRDRASGGLAPLSQEIGSCGASPAMSPDGRSLYTAAGNFGNALSLFSRNARTGRLAPARCIGHDAKGCREARHLPAPVATAITPDGRFVYVVSDDFNEGQTIGVFRRSLR